MKFETLAVRAGAEPDVETGALAPPIHLSTTFEHGPAAETPKGYLYVRENNPTQVRLQEALAALEAGEEAMAFASGIGAGAAFLQALPPESHVIFADDIYYDFRTIATEFFPGWNKTASMVDLSDPKNLESELRDETKLVWLETPSNPLLKVVDIEAVAAIAHRAGAKVIVDSTFATPALQRPLTLGADAVLQSTTKLSRRAQRCTRWRHHRQEARRAPEADAPRPQSVGRGRLVFQLVARPSRHPLTRRASGAASGHGPDSRSGARRAPTRHGGALPRTCRTPRSRGRSAPDECFWRHPVLRSRQ